MSVFTNEVQREVGHLIGISPGVCMGCEKCEQSYGVEIEVGRTGEEPFFSSRPCQSCGTHFAGDRLPAHGLHRDGDPEDPQEWVHLEMCSDCVQWHANGEEPLYDWATDNGYQE